MPRKIRKRKKEDISKIRESVKKEKESIENALPSIVKDTGGSISNLPVKTKEYKNWLTDIRKNINPLIGKSYLTSAPEFDSEDKLVDDQKVEDTTPELAKVLSQGAGKFDLEKDFSPEVKELGKGPKAGVDEKIEKFMDQTIVENTTKKFSTREDDQIREHAESQIKTYHDDPTYETDIDIDEVISTYKNMLVIQADAKKKLLENTTKKTEK